VLRVTVHADKRSREVKPAPQAERAAQEAQRAIARAEHRGAKALALIEKRRAPVVSGYTSAQAWAEANGYGDQQARRLLALGRALAAAPELENKMRSGTVSSDAVLAVGKVLCEPSLKLGAAERATWLERACTLPPRQLREEGHPRFTFHPGPLHGPADQPSEVRERAPPRYAARRRTEMLVGSGSVPFG